MFNLFNRPSTPCGLLRLSVGGRGNKRLTFIARVEPVEPKEPRSTVQVFVKRPDDVPVVDTRNRTNWDA